MTNMKRFEFKQSEVPSEEALAPMRTLTTKELVEIVGGPDIQNGGATGVATTNVTSSTGG